METNLYGYSFADPVNFIDSDGKYGNILAISSVALALAIWDYYAKFKIDFGSNFLQRRERYLEYLDQVNSRGAMSSQKKTKELTGDYRAAWRAHKMKKFYLLAAAMPTAVGLFVSFYLVDNFTPFNVRDYPLVHFFVGSVPWVLGYIALGLKLLNLTCPRCGARFHGDFFQLRFWGRSSCSKCRLRMNEVG